MSTPERPSDHELAVAVRAGSDMAFGRLFERHHVAIYNFCFRRTASWGTADDLTSIVFLEAWRCRDRIGLHDDSVLPWLYGIATNVCRNQRRSSLRHRQGARPASAIGADPRPGRGRRGPGRRREADA